MEEKKLIEVIEIWRPCTKGETGDGMISYHEKKGYKRIALLVEGYPNYLEKDIIMERHLLDKKDAKSRGLIKL